MDLAGNLALEAAQDLFLGSALGGASGDVFLGGLVAVHADQGDPPQGAIAPRRRRGAVRAGVPEAGWFGREEAARR